VLELKVYGPVRIGAPGRIPLGRTLYFNVLDLATWDEASYGTSVLRQTSLDRIWTVDPLNDGKPNPAKYGFAFRYLFGTTKWRGRSMEWRSRSVTWPASSVEWRTRTVV
jgi:hypothetical protein